jgi:hypothetical protein
MCDIFKQLKQTRQDHVLELKTWCQEYYNSNVMKKPDKFQEPHSRSRREPALPATLGAAFSLFPALLPIAAIAVVGVIIVGVTSFLSARNRIERRRRKSKS